MRTLITATGVIATLVTLTSCGQTQNSASADDYPDRTIDLIVPVPAGSSTDVSTRFVVPCLEEELDATIVVENRDGGGGAVGNGLFAQAEADGYTLVSTSVGNAVVPPIAEGGVGYEPDSFLPLGMIGQAPVVLVVAADSPYTTAEDFFDAATSERLVVGIPGPTSVPGISLKALTTTQDLQLEAVPFTGNGNTIQALLGGEVDAAYLSADGGVTLPRIQSGEVLALATAVEEPAASLPDVPTLVSLGYDGLPLGDSFWFLATQVDTPEPIVAALEAAMETCMSNGDVQAQIGEGVAPPEFIPGSDVQEMLETAATGYEEFLQ